MVSAASCRSSRAVRTLEMDVSSALSADASTWLRSALAWSTAARTWSAVAGVELPQLVRGRLELPVLRADVTVGRVRHAAPGKQRGHAQRRANRAMGAVVIARPPGPVPTARSWVSRRTDTSPGTDETGARHSEHARCPVIATEKMGSTPGPACSVGRNPGWCRRSPTWSSGSASTPRRQTHTSNGSEPMPCSMNEVRS
jgi:hypothetical protein